MINLLITIIKVIFLLGILVLIHEGGHFIVAKLCKVKVNEFAIGFGPTIFKRKKGETVYALRLFPLGGFVSMEGEEERSEEEGSFSKTSIPKRIAIVAAGGIVNIIFAVLVYFIISASMGNFISQEILEVKPNYGAEQAGIQANDVIVKINNKKIRTKTDIDKIMESCNGNEVTVQVNRNNKILDITVKPTELQTKDTGIYLGAEGESITSKIVSIYPKSPAEEAGLKVNDVIKMIDDNPVENDAYKVVEYIKSNTNEKVKFTVERKGELINIEVKPNKVYTYLLGVQFKETENNIINNIYYAFWDTAEFTFSIVDNVKMLLSGGISKEQLMGPIGISGIVSETNSIVDFAYIMALISLSLGITNLLPFPPLDGGKIVIYIIEAIRRKPMKENVEATIQLIGFAALIALSIYVSYNDILRIF